MIPNFRFFFVEWMNVRFMSKREDHHRISHPSNESFRVKLITNFSRDIKEQLCGFRSRGSRRGFLSIILRRWRSIIIIIAHHMYTSINEWYIASSDRLFYEHTNTRVFHVYEYVMRKEHSFNIYFYHGKIYHIYFVT